MNEVASLATTNHSDMLFSPNPDTQAEELEQRRGNIGTALTGLTGLGQIAGAGQQHADLEHRVLGKSGRSGQDGRSGAD
jgi:hypothetical protein